LWGIHQDGLSALPRCHLQREDARGVTLGKEHLEGLLTGLDRDGFHASDSWDIGVCPDPARQSGWDVLQTADLDPSR
jgi:hypothetical protein